MTDIIEVVDDTTIVAVVEQAPTIIVEVPQDDETTVVEIHVPGPQGPGSTIEIGGDNTQVQFNDGGLLAGDPTFVFDKGTKALGAQILETSEIQFPSVDGTLTVTPAAVTADVSKVMVVADSQTVGETINFGDTVLRSGDIYIYDNNPDIGFYAGSQLAHITKTTTVGDLVTHQLSRMGYMSGSPGFYVRDSIYNNATSEYDSYAIANLRAGSLSFNTSASDITTIVPNGGVVGNIEVVWPAESGTLARVEELNIAFAILGGGITALYATFDDPSSVAGVLTLDFAGKARAIFTVTLHENVTSIVYANLPSDVFLEHEIHYAQNGTGGWTVAQPASHHALGGSDTAVAAAAGAVTVFAGSSVDGGTTWRYAMQESA